MEKTFIEMKLFQVKPDRHEQFEAKIEEMSANQLQCEGCISLKYFKPTTGTIFDSRKIPSSE